MKRFALLLAVMVAGSAHGQVLPDGINVDAFGYGHANNETIETLGKAIRIFVAMDQDFNLVHFHCGTFSDPACIHEARELVYAQPQTAADLLEYVAGASKDGQRDADGFLRHGCGATVEGCKTDAQLIEAPAPEYTAAAIAAHYSGVCLVQLTVGTDGAPTNLEILQHVPWGLDQKALAAVRQYKFKPATADGKAIASTTNIQVNFKFHSR